VHNYFEISRNSAYKVHLDAGFKIIKEEKNIVDLLININDYKAL
jgi:hypothetical protein